MKKHDALSAGASHRNIHIHPDLMPRKVEVKKSTVLLTVKNVPWNEETALIVGENRLDLNHAQTEPYSRTTR